MNKKRDLLIVLGVLAALFLIPLGVRFFLAFPVIDNPAVFNSQSVKWDLKLSHPYVAQNSDGELVLNLRFKGTERKAKGKRTPLNLVLVIDRSGSMADKGKLEYAKKAATQIVSALRSTDRLGLVSYSDNVQLLYPLQFLEARDVAIIAINSLTPTNSTNLSGGLVKGIEELKGVDGKGRLNRLILLSDGLANRGITAIPQLSRIASDAAETGIGITTMGLGLHFDENLLMSLAEHGTGNYYFIESPAQVASIFEREFGEMINTVAKSPAVYFRFPKGVEVKEVYGYEYSEVDGGIRINTGDLYGGQERNIMVKIKVPTDKPGKQSLGSATFQYMDMNNGAKPVRLVKTLSYHCTEDKKMVEVNKNELVIAQKVSKDAALSLYRAAGDYEGGRRNDAIGKVQSALEELSNLNKSSFRTEETERQEFEMRGALRYMQTSAPSPQSVEGKRFLKQHKARARELQK